MIMVDKLQSIVNLLAFIQRIEKLDRHKIIAHGQWIDESALQVVYIE